MDQTELQPHVRGPSVSVAFTSGSSPEWLDPSHHHLSPHLTFPICQFRLNSWATHGVIITNLGVQSLGHQSVTLSLPQSCGGDTMPRDTCPDGRVRLASLCAGAKPTAVQTLHTSQAVRTLPLSFCVRAGGRISQSCCGNQTGLRGWGSQRLVLPQFCPLLKAAAVPQLSSAIVCSLARGTWPPRAGVLGLSWHQGQV